MVYVLISNYINVDDGSCESNVIGVYENVEDALKQMKQEMTDTKIDFDGYDTEEDDYVEGDMSWSIWEKGEYMSHHCDLIITEHEIK